MERFFKKLVSPLVGTQEAESSHKRKRLDSNSNFEVPPDPGLRPPISNYDPNDHDFVRRQYLQAGPRQPMLQDFPQTLFGDKQRRFNKAWYSQYPYWLEYSIQKDAAYCLCCYLFKPENREGGGDAFTSTGFKNWKNKKSLDEHVGGLNSAHNLAMKKCQDLMKQNQHIQTVLERESKRSKNAYRLRLTATVDCIRWLLRQGLAFRGHDESKKSLNRGNFLELLQFLADHNAQIEGVVLENAPGKMMLIAPPIQKDIIKAAAIETTNKIMEELGDDLFSVLVDESRDVSCKEQMAVLLRYVSKQGSIVERFLAVVHVKETTSISLKESLEELFCRHKLSFSRLRGQGYDGASNMRGEFNGLKALILNENSSAYYVHCFAHQLQLVLVAVAEKHKRIATLFEDLSTAQNTVGVSCKRRDKLREKRAAEVQEALGNDELSTGTGLNQEIGLARPVETRWSSHYKSLTNLTILFGSIMAVLDDIMENAEDSRQGAKASRLLDSLTTFEFAFSCIFMKNVLGITHELSQALQKKRARDFKCCSIGWSN
ncbi:zinc finger MYM-type-like protein [Rhynchospora pubera]|uniref:Zinc finger MYM-type-like protein n=1 Tax=Rhynchospora pubera TaxID=906938 RepID=A0AAV8CIZ8_9POAL|nr:zinc finger MYM-type-like protein [Rhynchospora pubera]